MLFAFFLTSCVYLGLSALLLVTLGARVRFANRLFGAVVVVAVILASGQIAAEAWSLPSHPVESAEIFLGVVGLVVVISRTPWNGIGQLFFGSFLGAAISYVIFALNVTFASHLSVARSAARTRRSRARGRQPGNLEATRRVAGGADPSSPGRTRRSRR
jgi:hypothetical protein